MCPWSWSLVLDNIKPDIEPDLPSAEIERMQPTDNVDGPLYLFFFLLKSRLITSIFELVSLELLLKWQVCGLLNPLVCAFKGLYY